MTAIRERIMQNIAVVLEQISTANGYNNTLQGVYRFEQKGNSTVKEPFLEILPVSEDIQPAPEPYVTCTLTLNLDVWVRHSKSEFDGSTDAYLITFLQDITRAIMSDTSRGGLAIDTKITGNYPFVTVEGQPYAGVTVTVEIRYRHKRDDLTSL